MNYKNLIEVIQDRKEERKGITFIYGTDDQSFFSYSQLYKHALTMLFYLQSKGLKPGDELLFQLDDLKDFTTVFWACQLGKIIPVPITKATRDDQRLKLFNIWKVLTHPYLIISEDHIRNSWIWDCYGENRDFIKAIKKKVIYLEGANKETSEGEIFLPGENDISFIQFSSGSTSDPKGVILSHKNLLANIKAILKGAHCSSKDSTLSWLPLTHDMGIIGFHLVPLVGNWNQYLMTTASFIRHPMLWLKKLSEYNVTLTVSPNFGYKYVLNHFERAKHTGIDLSCLRLIINGAEPISANLCAEFLDKMAPLGLKRNTMFPVYGLAEASLAVSFSEPGKEIFVTNLDRDTLGPGEKIKEKNDGVKGVALVQLGSAVEDCFIRIVDDAGNILDEDVVGHIQIKGHNVTSGYYNNRDATSKTFTPDGWLRTGDLGLFRKERLFVTGRVKDIIFVKGQNYYAHDMERVAGGLEGIDSEKIAFCGIFNREIQADEVVCFMTSRKPTKEFLPLAGDLKKHMMKKVGIEINKIIPVKKIPRTTSGKIQRYKLKNQYLAGTYDPISEEIDRLQKEMMPAKRSLTKVGMKRVITETWCDVLDLETANVSGDENFFDMGGNSTYALQVKAKLQEALGRAIDEMVIFTHPTINALAEYLSTSTFAERPPAVCKATIPDKCRGHGVLESIKKRRYAGKNDGCNGLEIAVIGISGRFPGAKTIAQFWDNLKNGIETISFFSDEELNQGGVDLQLLENPDYVKAKGVLESSQYFDAAFFGYTTAEAENMDPQARIFHECLWEAVEDAGHDPGTFNGLIGVYAGASPNPFWDAKSILSGRKSAAEQFADTQMIHKDFMTTRISYKLNLQGPSFNMYTACSTSLVAIDLACQGLLTGKCDMALAGGVSLWLPPKSGYLYEDGMVFSRDGHNRTFDARACGTVFSDGAGIVVLKRLEQALRDRDHIYAVIKGSAVNNDGDRKIGYTAPALEGQAEVIAAAQQMADVEPESIGYVEAHGTGTSLGDPIEVQALALAFHTGKKNYCALGSVKSNIGHLNTAAGAAGFIKTLLAIKNRMIPPDPHFHRSNPRIDFQNSPFYVNAELKVWENNGYPLRAGVSSFGIGGTNAHVILEEAPVIGHSSLVTGENRTEREYRLILLSAKTETALQQMTQNLACHFPKKPDIQLADAAYTLQTGRKTFKHRRMLVCSDGAEAISTLSLPGRENLYTFCPAEDDPPVVFMFPGQGSQYVNMGRELYEKEPGFRSEMGHCLEILDGFLDENIKEILYPNLVSKGSPPDFSRLHRLNRSNMSHESYNSYTSPINQTEIAQPVLFIFGYALARLLMNWGITPYAMIGHSIGEYVAACLAGVFSLEDALKLVALRGKLMQKMPIGAMLSVNLAEEQLKPLLDNKDEISLAAVNSSSLCVLSGSHEVIEEFAGELNEKGYQTRVLRTSHAFHSRMMDPILKEFEEEVKKIPLNKPKIPYISNVSGTWLTDEEALQPTYWCSQLRQTVRFANGLKVLLEEAYAIFLELGPGSVLSTCVRKHKGKKSNQRVVNFVRHARENIADSRHLLDKIGHLWLYGKKIDWERFHINESRYRVSLPTYPFDSRYFGFENPAFWGKGTLPGMLSMVKKPDIGDWFYMPTWKRSRSPQSLHPTLPEVQEEWLVFTDSCGFGSIIINQLKKQGQAITVVRADLEFNKSNDREYSINPREDNHYRILFNRLKALGRIANKILHLWCVSRDLNRESVMEEIEDVQDKGFYSLLSLARELGKQAPEEEFQIKVVSNNFQEVGGEEYLRPEKATLLGAVKVISMEFPNINCCSIDIVLPDAGSSREEKLAGQLISEFNTKTRDQDKDHYNVIAYRNNHRWVQRFEPVQLEKPGKAIAGLREQGVYLISGGTGGIGLIIAEHLARSVKAKLILTGRSAFPVRDEWDNWLAAHQENKDEKISQKIHRIREIEALGAEVLVLSADVVNIEQMQQVISRAQQCFGKINGVIHAAGVPDGALILRRTREMSEAILNPKVIGALVLDRIFKDHDLDFLLFCSSIALILPLPGQAAYVAANAFLDAFAASKTINHSNNTTQTISINWDRWQNVGMAVFAEKEHKRLFGENPTDGITPGEGKEVITRILADPLPQVVVSTCDLEHRTAGMKSLSVPFYSGRLEYREHPQTISQRPELSVTYVEPGNETEEKLAEIWRDFLGIDRVGVHDNFFELGATSLDIFQVNKRLKKEFTCDIPVVTMYSYPTIALLASFFNRQKGEENSSDGDSHQHTYESLAKGQEKMKHLRSRRRPK